MIVSEANGASFDVLGRERRSRLPTLSSRLISAWIFWLQVGAIAEPSEQRGVDLAGRCEFAGGDGRCRQIFGKARRELLLIVLTEALHQLAESHERQVELPGLGARHRQDDLGQCLDRTIGIRLQVLLAELFGLAEPVVFDGLVEECGIRLVAIVGLGVFLEVFRQLANEGPIMLGLNLGDPGGRSGRELAVRERESPERKVM